jgi:hypothetical protein
LTAAGAALVSLALHALLITAVIGTGIHGRIPEQERLEAGATGKSMPQQAGELTMELLPIQNDSAGAARFEIDVSALAVPTHCPFAERASRKHVLLARRERV